MASPKKGAVLSIKDPLAYKKIMSLNPSWYYTWGQEGIRGLPVPFIPMAWGRTAGALPAMLDGAPLLGFNEPDGVAQSNLTPKQAMDAWPSIVETGKRIGSPATAGNPAKDGSWLDQFVALGGTFDFVCVHWYAPPNVASFLAEIDAIYVKYKKPIWVTEFAVADWSGKFPGGFPPSLVEAFMRDACTGLDTRSYVEKYTWKTRSTSDSKMGTSALFNDDGHLTALGIIYSAL
jgi:hypothetical protein